VAKVNLGEDQGSLEELSIMQCKISNSEHSLFYLFSISTLSVEVPCPVCIENGSLAHGSFNVKDCRLLLNEQDEQGIGTVTYSTCAGSFRIMDVVTG
jgi:hypothetical protein